jgi:magnesium chelatase family protein
MLIYVELMSASVSSVILQGLKPIQVKVEVASTRGIPKVVVIGLATRVVVEARQRILTALKNNNIKLKSCRTVINLTPPDVPKKQAYLDLAMIAGLLNSYGLTSFNEQDAFIGELGLDGSVRAVAGCLGLVLALKELGLKRVFVPVDNFANLKVINDLRLVPIKHLKELFKEKHHGFYTQAGQYSIQLVKPEVLLDDLVCSERLKRVLQIVAAGRHHLLMTGPPGGGKTLLAQALGSILPPLAYQESLAVSQIHSLFFGQDRLITLPVLRQPHHTISLTGLIGGGSQLNSGEITLAHHGILFLDEINLFKTEVIEALRQPLETGQINLNRMGQEVKYPASFTLVAAQNPCPCGYYGTEIKACACTPWKRQRHQQKLSGAIKDRIDLFVDVPMIKTVNLLASPPTVKKVEAIEDKIIIAREIQTQRYESATVKFNGQLTTKQIKKYIHLNYACQQLLSLASDKFKLSNRAVFKVIKIARTTADLDQQNTVSPENITEALSYRQRIS